MRSALRLRATLVAVGLALISALAAAPVAAQGTTFTVTVGAKTGTHPNPGGPVAAAYYLDGTEGLEVHLTRGVTYTFQMQGVPVSHPFYLSTSAVGGGTGVYSAGVTGNFATGNAAVTFTPGAATPDLLYYQCGSHGNMGWRIYVSDAPPSPVALDEVADGFTSPVGLVEAPDGTGRLFVVDQAGQVRIVTSGGAVLPTPFLDVQSRMVALSPGYDERGLLGLAFHPDYATNGRLYALYSAPLRAGAPTDYNHTARLVEFTVSSDPDVADAASERLLLEVDEPQMNHNGGQLAFGPDGYLYVSLGDGGAADDVGPGHVDDWYAANTGGNGQDVTENLLGSILRLDVDGPAPYGIPADNPFVGRDGRDEVYAYGFRNPWRFAFDPGGQHDLLVGDAGQNLWEEVSRVERGGNYGWNVMEGTHCFSTANPDEPMASCPTQVGAGHPDTGAPLIGPVVEYSHPGVAGGYGLVVVAGAVYRGTAVPELGGRYVFADWSDSFGAPTGQLFVAQPRDGDDLWAFDPLPLVGSSDGSLPHYVLGFGQDAAGEVYVLTTDNAGPSGSTGRVYRLAAGTTAAEPLPAAPRAATLAVPAPNPFAVGTTVRYALTAPGTVQLTVVDLLGREVRRLYEGTATAGTHDVRLDGAGLADGVYVVRLAVDGAVVATQEVTLAR